MKFITSKGFYRSLAAITIPIAMQNLITQATSMMDTIMLGRADTTGVALSGSSLANQPFFILSLICFGLSGAAGVLASQYWGKRDMKSIRIIFSLIMKAAFILSALLGLAVLCFPVQVMRIYSGNEEIIAAGADYLRIIGFAYFIFGITNTMLCSLRSVELVRISVVVNLASFCTNVFLNWVLIFGNLGAPAMGIRGAALATLCARLLEFVITFGYLFFFDKRLGFRPKDLLLFDKVLAKDLLRHGTPVTVNELIWAMGISMQAVILGHITYAAGDPVAANSITSVVQQLCTIVIFGIGSATQVFIGKSIGEEKLEYARQQAFTLKYITLGISVIVCIMILLLREPVLRIYTIPEETKEIARQLMTVIAFVTIFVAYSTISIVGVLRGGGDTQFCMWIEMICLWGVAIPLAFAGSKLQLPVWSVMILMKIDEVIKSVICTFRMRRNKWIRILTR